MIFKQQRPRKGAYIHHSGPPICGKTFVQDTLRGIETALFDLQVKKDVIPARIEVGAGTLQALKMATREFCKFKSDGVVSDAFMGILVKVNDLLPPDGYAFCDSRGNVLAIGTLMKDGRDD